MRKLVYAVALVVTAALSASLGATTSLAAATTWTVSPGGSISSPHAQFLTLMDAKAGKPGVIQCRTQSDAPSGLTGSLQSGTGLNGSDIGTITSVELGTCGAQLNTSWRVNFHFYRANSGAVGGAITRIHFVGRRGSCSFVLDGTSATAHNGRLPFTYFPKTDTMNTNSAIYSGNLHFYNVRCPTYPIHNGDLVYMSGSFDTITPAQTITSP
jgi:hypothetical protein